MKKQLPLYKAVLRNDDEGMVAVSFVDCPAIEIDWLAFEKQTPLQFSIENEDKHIVKGVLMRVDHPIYRIGTSGYEYYIQFDKDTLRQIAQKYLMDGYQNNVDTMHNHEIEEGVYMQELFFKDVENGINPKGFEEVEDGSLFAQFKVENEEVWNEIKEGKFKGFSIEIFCDAVEVSDPEEEEYNNIMSLLEQIKNKIK